MQVTIVVGERVSPAHDIAAGFHPNQSKVLAETIYKEKQDHIDRIVFTNNLDFIRELVYAYEGDISNLSLVRLNKDGTVTRYSGRELKLSLEHNFEVR